MRAARPCFQLLVVGRSRDILRPDRHGCLSYDPPPSSSSGGLGSGLVVVSGVAPRAGQPWALGCPWSRARMKRTPFPSFALSTAPSGLSTICGFVTKPNPPGRLCQVAWEDIGAITVLLPQSRSSQSSGEADLSHARFHKNRIPSTCRLVGSRPLCRSARKMDTASAACQRRRVSPDKLRRDKAESATTSRWCGPSPASSRPERTRWQRATRSKRVRRLSPDNTRVGRPWGLGGGNGLPKAEGKPGKNDCRCFVRDAEQ